MKKRFFVEMLKEICAEADLKLEIFSHEWLCKVTDEKSKKVIWTEGYNFGLNTDVNYLTLYDKVSTSIVLVNGNVPCIQHFLIIKELWRENLNIQKNWKTELEEILEMVGNKVVIKFATGSMGKNIYLCSGKDEIYKQVESLKDLQSLAISKYYASEFEYRFYILEGEILFAYKKIKNETSDWKHNLSCGATAELIIENFPKYIELEKIALDAFSVLKLKVGAVDILDTEEGYKVIEVNNGIMMDSFAATNGEYREIAKKAHKKMLFKALEKSTPREM